MKKTAKTILCVLLALVMAMPWGVLPKLSAQAAEETVRLGVEATDAGQMNYFVYTSPNSSKSWSVFAGSEAYIDLGASETNAEQYFYEISFVGSGITLFANKSHNHGIVKYSVDGGLEQTVDLYNSSRTTAQAVYRVSGLAEGRHTLKAVTQPTKNASSKSIVNQVAYAEIVHTPYTANEIVVNQASMSLYAGETQKISYTVMPAGASAEGLVFRSSAEDVALVSADGTVTAKAPGKAVITLSGIGEEKTVAVEVKAASPRLGGMIADTDMQHTQDTYNEVKRGAVTEAALTAWKNDKAASELVLYSEGGPLKNVSVTASPLVTADGKAKISQEQVTLTFMKSTLAYNDSGRYIGYGSPTRPIPEGNRLESSDILYQKGGTVDIPFNSLQPVWVEFAVPADAEAGLYTGTLTVQAEGLEESLEFTYRLLVQDMVLPNPEEFSFDIGLWQYPYSSAEYYGVEPFSQEHLEILRPIMEKYREIGGNSITATMIEDAWSGQTYSANQIHYPSMIRWTKTGDQFTYDYSDFDTWVSFCKDEIGIADKVVIYSILPWGNAFTYWEDGTMKTESYTVGSSRYITLWEDFLNDFARHLTEKGWFEDCYLGIDERNFNADVISHFLGMTNSEGKNWKVAGDMDNFTAAGKGDMAKVLSSLNVGDTAAAGNQEAFQALLAERNAGGLETTLYSCTEHKPGNFSLSAPVESYWSAVNAGKAGASGFQRWAYDAWVADPLNDATHNSFEPGDTFIIYPSEKDGEEREVKSSVRLERMAEGIRDVNKLRILEREMPGLADDIQEVYARVKTTARHSSHTYMTEEEIAGLAEEMSNFKAGVAAVTEKYLAAVRDLSIAETEKTLNAGEMWQIEAEGAGELIFRSANPSVASVDAKGNVRANAKGRTVITVEDKAAGSVGSVQILVTRTLIISNSLTDYKLPQQYLSDVERDPDDSKGRHYLGQPDMVMLDDEKTLITVYPVGHGKGSVVMQVSRDAGETWNEKTDIPQSWSSSYETPTLYKLNMTNGDTRLIMICGRPASFGAPTGGWDVSLSDDLGETWSEFDTYCENFSDGSRNDSVVAMASMIQMKDEEGRYLDKWMCVYHNLNYVNYKTYLTFNKEGEPQWTEPEPYLSEYRQIESSHQMCEIGMFRSPDGKRIVGLARSQSHNHPATMIYSDDEGDTWSKPVELPGSLAGERHKILYDPTDPAGQRLLITFREIQYDKNGNNQFDGANDWMAGDWIAWVGTYDDIMNQRDGQYRVLLCEDWAANRYSGDTGYTGMAVTSDGTFILDTYGHWDKEYSENLPNYSVYNDQCWIKQAKFKLSDLDGQVLPEIKEALRAEIERVPMGDASMYTKKSWAAYQEALAKAHGLLEAEEAGQLECFHAIDGLVASKRGLLSWDTLEPEDTTEAREALRQVIRQAAAYTDASKYTAESWAVFQKAFKDAKAVEAEDDSTIAALKLAASRLRTAILGLKAAGGTVNPPQPENPVPIPDVRDGQTFESGSYRYKVVSATGQMAEVTGLVKGKAAKLTKLVVPGTVKFKNKTYKVISVGASAFKGSKKAVQAVIGKNVQVIGKNAFASCPKLKTVKVNSTALKEIGTKAFFNCKKLTSISIKSKGLKKVGAQAFKGISRRAVIKVPAAKLKAYKKLLAKKGQSRTVTIKK